MNKEKLLVFVDPKKHNFYSEGENTCNKCGKKLLVRDAYFLVSEYSTNLNRHQILCLDCIKKYKPIGVISERKLVFIVSELPDRVIPVLLTPPRLKSFSGDTIFSAVNKDVELNIDKTRLAIPELIEETEKKLRIEKK